MSKDVELLRYYLTTQPKMPINELKNALKLDSYDELMEQVMEVFESELKSFNFLAQPANHYTLGICLDYLEYDASKFVFKDKGTYSKITNRLVKLINPIETMMDNPGGNKSYLTYKNNYRLLESARDRIVDYKKKHEGKPEIVDTDWFTLMYDMAFKYKRIEYIKKILQEKPNLANIKDKLNKPLIEYMVEKYLSNINDESDLNQIFYYESLVTLFSKNYKDPQSLPIIQNAIIQKLSSVRKEYRNQVVKQKRLEFSLYQVARNFRMQYLFPSHVQNLSYKYKVNNFFDDDILKTVDKQFMYAEKDYKDYRDKHIVTIDDVNCHFREDAVSLTKDHNGNYQLGIYIADVDAMISEGSKLDLEALKRAVSVDETYQFLFPKDFLNAQISLLEKADHPVLAFNFTIDKHMNIIGFEVEKAIANIKHNYNYNEANNMINGNKGDHQLVRGLYDIASAIEDVRTNKAHVEIKNHPVITHANPGEYIISELSVFLNTHIANYFHDNDLPFIYRVDQFREHTDVVRQAENILGENEPRIMESIRGYSSPTQLSAVNLGFQSLARRSYGSVTNPGRWYDALVNQRLVKKFMVDNLICDRDTLVHYNSVVPFISECLNEKSELAYYYKTETSQNGLTKRK